MQALLEEILWCRQILDKEICPAYAEVTVKSKRTLTIFEECVSSPGLHKFDRIFERVIDKLVEIDASFRKEREDAEADWYVNELKMFICQRIQ